jgi:hypothetical protein
MELKKVHIATANFGRPNAADVVNMVEQDTEHSITTIAYTDSNSKYSRELALHPRLKGKIPRMLEWMNIDADFYIWMDSNFKITSPLFIEEMIKALGNYDICLHPHEHRSSILEEGKFVHHHLINNEDEFAHKYLVDRYKGEPIMDQVESYLLDDSFQDLNLFSTGFFIFNKRIIENKNYNLMTDWFFHNCYWTVQDQLSLPYLLHKHNINYTTFPYNVYSNPYAQYVW